MAQAASRVESLEPKSTVGGSESRAVAAESSKPVPLKHDWVFWHDKYVFPLHCLFLSLLRLVGLSPKKKMHPLVPEWKLCSFCSVRGEGSGAHVDHYPLLISSFHVLLPFTQ